MLGCSGIAEFGTIDSHSSAYSARGAYMVRNMFFVATGIARVIGLLFVILFPVILAIAFFILRSEL